MEKILFTLDDIKVCSDFAEKMDTSLYAKRNQSDIIKRTQDSRNGKIAEIVVYNLLKNKYQNLTYPDFNIYSIKDKSWDYDLKTTNINIICKSSGESYEFNFGK